MRLNTNMHFNFGFVKVCMTIYNFSAVCSEDAEMLKETTIL